MVSQEYTAFIEPPQDNLHLGGYERYGNRNTRIGVLRKEN